MSRPFRLQLFGGMQLLAPAEPSGDELARAALLDNRRRVLAVLTVLAVSPRSLTRDQLADFFWGDSEPVRARHSLAESLRLLRRVLGGDAVATRTADVMLDAAAPLESDVSRFLAAQAAGDHQAAVALYAADFLDGVYVDRAPRFDEWADRQREALRQAFAVSCAAECLRLVQHGDHHGATALARRWLDVAPLSREAAEAWFRAQLAPGTQEALYGARERFATYAAHLDTEYGATPDHRLAQLLDDAAQALVAHRSVAERVSAPPAAATADATVATPPDTRVVRTPRGQTPVASPTPPPSPTGTPAGTHTTSPAASPELPAIHRHRRSLVAATLLAVGAPLAAWRLGMFGTEPALAVEDGRRLGVVVADAENATPDSLLGHVVTLAVHTALGEFPTLRPLSGSRVRDLRRLTRSENDTAALRGPLTEPLARLVATRAGAQVVAVPVVVAMGERYRVALRVVRTDDGTLLGTTQSPVVESAGVLAAIDDVLQRLRRQPALSGADGAPLRPLPDFTTASLPALRAYAQGVRAFEREDVGGAVESYRQAVVLDSTFALGWTALATTLEYLNQPQAANEAFTAALRHEAHLTERERMLVRAAALRGRGLRDSANALRAAWLAAHPDDMETMAQQVYGLLTSGRHADAVALGEALVRRDSSDDRVLSNLALAYEGDDLPTRRRAVALYSRSLALNPAQRRNPMLPQLYGGLLVQAQLYDSAARFFRDIGAGDERLNGRAMRALGQMELRRARPAAAVEPFERAVAAGRALSDTLSWVRARLWLATTLYVVGDSARARAHTDSLVREAPLLREPPVQYWIGIHLARLGRAADAQSVLRALERTAVPSSRVHAANRAMLAGEIATARGQARRVRPSMTDAIGNDRTAISLETLAWTTLQAGDTVAARELAREVLAQRPSFGYEGWLAQERVRGWLERVGTDTRR